MTVVEKKVKGKLADFKIVAQILYTRFCQATTFTGRLAEAIWKDLESIRPEIMKFQQIGKKTLDYLTSEFGEEPEMKKERFLSMVQMCTLYIERMNQIIIAAETEGKNSDDKMVIQKCNRTVEEGRFFIEILQQLQQDAESELQHYSVFPKMP